jgi:aryl-alcohol dehydrogenase-like predicted oxidoreductase
MGMPGRRFGATGWELTTVGLGTWALGGADWAFGWGPQDDAEGFVTGARGLGALSAARSRRPGRRRCATARHAATVGGCR